MSIFPQLGRFKEFWCQKVLPLVYDDSLSFYEVLCRIKAKLNEVIENLNAQGKYIETQLPILIDETVRKYFNQNQNLPFIDCYAHGITEKLDDIGPALQELFTKYGSSYGYYMRGRVNYSLNSTVTLPLGACFRCEGTIKSTFNGKINLVNECEIHINMIIASTENAYFFNGNNNSCKITINYTFDFSDLFYPNSIINRSELNLMNVGQLSLFRNCSMLNNTIIIQRLGVSTNNQIEFGNFNINNCSISITEQQKLNITLGTKNQFYTQSILGDIRTGADCQITLPANDPNSVIDVQPFTQLNGHTYFAGSSDMEGIVSIYGGSVWFGKAIQDHYYSCHSGDLIKSWGVGQISLSKNNFSTVFGNSFLLTGFHGIVHCPTGITNCQVLVPRFGADPITMVASPGTTIIGRIAAVLESGHWYYVSCATNALRVFAYDFTDNKILQGFDDGVATTSEETENLNYWSNKWEREVLNANATTNSDLDAGAGD